MRNYKYFGQTTDQMINGSWVHTVSVPGGYYQTRSGQLWRGIKSRVTKKGYLDVEIKFKDYQEFAEFCLSQPLYMQRDSAGNYYHIDKDLKGIFLREYSKETCLFIPACLNTSLKDVRKFLDLGECGVSYHKPREKFRAYCNDGSGRQKHLGYYEFREDAQKAWLRQKSEQILLALEKEVVCQDTVVYTKGFVSMLRGEIYAN